MTQEQITYITDAASKGVSVVDMSKELNISQRAIKTYMTKNNISVRLIVRAPEDDLGFEPFTYKCKLLNVHDGDTISVEMDLGFDITFTEKIRFWGINAPELNTNEGQVALTKLKQLLVFYNTLDVQEIMVKTIKDRKEKYGRYLGVVYMPINKLSGLPEPKFSKSTTTLNINEIMLNEGFAKPMKY